MEVDAPSPEIAARNSLLQLIDIIKGDSEPLVSQLKYEPSYDLDKDWEDIKQKIHNREYTTYSSLALDLQKILDSVLSASKKNIKQQRPYSLSHKNIKKQLDQYERFMRARLYEWHPGGKQAAAKDEETYRVDQWNSLARIRTAELHAQSAAQLRNALTVQQRSRDANINESIARILETSQNVTSTHAFGEDPLAVHTWLGQGLPWVSEFWPDDLLDSDGEHPDAPTMRDSIEGATAVNLEDGKVIPRQDPKDAAPPKSAADVARGDAAANAGDAPDDDESSTSLRAAQWKCSWLELRMTDLSFLENQLTSMISQKEGRVARELAAAEDSPYLAGKSPRRPLLPLPASASDPASCGFSEDAMRGHPFFKECGAAVEAENADTVVPAVEGTVQDMSDDETAPAAAYWAFASIEDNVHAFLNYISSEQGGGADPATATAAPSKVPKKAPPRPRSHVQVPMPPSLGRRGSERKPNQRRESSLPEEVRSEITRKLEKPYVPPTRVLTSDDIAARIEDESSGEDDTSDAYYLRLHDAELAKKDEADKAGAGENRDRAHRRQQPTTSAPLSTGAGRGRVAGKGPVNAVSASTGGQLATSATPSGCASNTHAGQLSSGGARVAHDVRSTLPALVGPNNDNAVAASVTPLTTTAAVGGTATATVTAEIQQQPVPSFVVAAPHRFNNSPNVAGGLPGTVAGGLPRSISAPAQPSTENVPTAAPPAAPPAARPAQRPPGLPTASVPTVPTTKPPEATGAAAAVPEIPSTKPHAATGMTAVVPAATPAAATPAAPAIKPGTAAPAVPVAKPVAAPPAVPASKPAVAAPVAAPVVPAAKPVATAPVVPAAKPVAVVPAVPASKPAAAAPATAATASAVANAHGVVRSGPRPAVPVTAAAAPSVPAAPSINKSSNAQPLAPVVRPAVACPAAIQPVRPGVTPAQAQAQRAATTHRPRPSHVPAPASSPAAAHMHAAVAAAAAAAASNKAAVPGAGVSARPSVPGGAATAGTAKPQVPGAATSVAKGAKMGPAGSAKHTPPVAVASRTSAPASVIAPAPAHGVVHTTSTSTAAVVAPAAVPAAAATRAGGEQAGKARVVPEGGQPARKMSSDLEGLRTKRTSAELNPIDTSKSQAPARSAGAPGMGSSPRKKKMRSK